MNTPLPRIAALLLSAGCLLNAQAGDANDIEQVRATTARLINMLIEQGVLSREKAEALLKDAAAPASAPTPASGASVPAGTVRVPYVPEFVRKQLKEEIRTELRAEAEREGWAGPGTVPEWSRRMVWDGDLRTRFEFDRFAASNAQQVSVSGTNSARSLVLLNTTKDQERMLLRARLGMVDTLDENWSAGVRFATGNSTNPVSSNQTLGVYETHYTATFDRAYIRYHSGNEVNAVLGRFGNPWFGTDLVWATDLGFDGAALQWTPQIGRATRGFFTVAALPVQAVNLTTSNANKWLVGAQAGIEQAQIFGNVSGKFGLAYYDYIGLAGKVSPTGSSLNEYTAPAFAQKGNTYYNISSDATKPLLGLASNYRLIDLTGAVDVPAVLGKHVILTGDFVKNVGFKSSQASSLTGTTVTAQTNGLMLRAALGDGEVAKRGDWQVFAGYKRVERDAVLDAFTDSDFHLGGTDAKGFFVGGSYGLGRNTAVSFRMLSADAIAGAPQAIDVWQIDLNLRF